MYRPLRKFVVIACATTLVIVVLTFNRPLEALDALIVGLASAIIGIAMVERG